MEEETWGDPSLPNLLGGHGEEGTHLLVWSPWTNQARWE